MGSSSPRGSFWRDRACATAPTTISPPEPKPARVTAYSKNNSYSTSSTRNCFPSELLQLFCLQSCPKHNLKTSNRCPSSTAYFWWHWRLCQEVKEYQPSPGFSLTSSQATSLCKTRHRDVHPVIQHFPFLPPPLWRQIGMGQINNDNYAHQMLRRRVWVTRHAQRQTRFLKYQLREHNQNYKYKKN